MTKVIVKPIPFSAPMVQALLREIKAPGTGKTQTRRLMKVVGHKEITEFGVSTTYGYDWHFRDSEMRWHDFRHDDFMKRCPYQVGELRYVREHWRTVCGVDDLPPRDLIKGLFPISYEADGNPLNGRFRQGMHMPRWASRITLEITNVRAERLQDISEEDAWAEGCKRGELDDRGNPFPAEEIDPSGKFSTGWDYARDWFADLWDGINGPESWDQNNWVWVITFKPHFGNVNTMIERRAVA